MYQRRSPFQLHPEERVGSSIGDKITVVAIAAMVSFLLTLAIGVAT